MSKEEHVPAASIPLALPDASTASTAQTEQLDVQTSGSIKFDKLGPIVVRARDSHGGQQRWRR